MRHGSEMTKYEANAHFQRDYYKQRKLVRLLETMTKSVQYYHFHIN